MNRAGGVKPIASARVTIEHRLQYSDVGIDVTFPPVRGARPIEAFNAALQRELAK